MRQLQGEIVIPTRSGHNFIKGEKLRLKEISGTCITLLRHDGTELVIDAKNEALLEIGDDAICIYEPICRELTIREGRLLKKADRLFGQLKRRPDVGSLKSFWEIEGFLKENNAGYLSGFNIEDEKVLSDGMICDYGIKGELKLKFHRVNKAPQTIRSLESRSVIEATYNTAKNAIETWMEIVTKNEEEIFSSLEQEWEID
jgi:hypothetical protein